MVNMSPDAEDVDVSPSPEPGSEQENDQEQSFIMAEDLKQDLASSEEKSPDKASNGESKSKSNAKDPSRPRRKKARRACFACQRAHLTCGDERPCLRCIKRGLQDQCHDGVRKKAKYLHDAPVEALMPGFAGNYQMDPGHHMPGVTAESSVGSNSMAVSQAGNYFPPASAYEQYGPVSQAGPMGPPMMDSRDPMMGGYATHQNVQTPPRFQSVSSQQVSPVHNMSNTVDQNGMAEPVNPSFDGTYIDPNDPSLYNFDLTGLNFGNHYGALEFGMLGHMSGAVGTPDLDMINTMGGHSHQGSLSYDGSQSYGNPAFTQPFNQNYSNYVPNVGSRQSSMTNTWTGQNNALDAFAIAEASLTGTSPQSQNQDANTGYSTGSTTSPETPFAQPDHQPQQDLLRQSFSQPQPRKQVPLYNEPQRKRRRDTSEIYTTVQAPYPYTQGFHALTAFLQKRFPSKKTLRIAKALASIRPSFISCNKNLNHDDLIFMEKCFQRTLCEYEDFVNHYGTPTIICRRTGEIAAVSKEFSLVTGWRRDVLLGKEPNLNINTGGNERSGTQTGTSSRGAQTPRIPNVEIDPGHPQPVFLAELLDEDNVVQFYEDFAELAFGASRTSIIGQTCSLLKYKTKEDPGWGSKDQRGEGELKRLKRTSTGEVKPSSSEVLMRGEAGMNALGERDGRVECSMCWTVKRDVFDIPMLIVMNFLPII